MVSPKAIDPYLIPGTSVLRNGLGITTSDDLAAAEADLSFARAMQLVEEPVAVTNDLTELQRIHFHLFQDIYDWAGQIRTIDVRKNIPGAEFFLPHGYIEHAAARAGSDQQDIGPLIAMFDKIVTSPDLSHTEDWASEEIRRLSIAPNDK